MTDLPLFGLADVLMLIGTLSMAFALLCALSDYAIPRLVLLRRRRRPEQFDGKPLAPMMSEEWER